ncbi:hypothetical protein GGI07_002876, partial [Coemansia sp. Benny D115]
MLGSDSSKRQRTDDLPSVARSASASYPQRPQSISPAPSSSGSDHPPPDSQPRPQPRPRTRDLIEHLLASQERLVAEVARLQLTVDMVLSTLRQSQIGTASTADADLRRSAARHSSRPPPLGSAHSHSPRGGAAGAIPPFLPNIAALRNVRPSSEPAASDAAGATPMSPQPLQDSDKRSTANAASSSSDNNNNSSNNILTAHSSQQQHDQPYGYPRTRPRNLTANLYSTPPPPALLHPQPALQSAGLQSAMSLVSMSSATSANLLPPSATASQASPRGISAGSSARSPPAPALLQQAQHRQPQSYQHGIMLPPPPSTPLSAPPTAS